MRDMISNIQVVDLGTLTLSGTTAAVSTYVDIKGFDGATIAIIPDAVTDAGTAAGLTVTLQESEDTTGAGAGTVAANETVNAANTATITTDADTSALALGYLGSDRYVGVSAVGTTGTDAVLRIVALLGKPHTAPTDFNGTGVART